MVGFRHERDRFRVDCHQMVVDLSGELTCFDPGSRARVRKSRIAMTSRKSFSLCKSCDASGERSFVPQSIQDKPRQEARRQWMGVVCQEMQVPVVSSHLMSQSLVSFRSVSSRTRASKRLG